MLVTNTNGKKNESYDFVVLDEREINIVLAWVMESCMQIAKMACSVTSPT